MRIGIKIRIDVKKIDKERLYKGEKGTYLDLVSFIDTDNPGKYGDHGPISQEITKAEKEQGTQLPILGNVKVFYGPIDGGQQRQGNQGGGQQRQPQGPGPDPIPDEDIPF